MSVLLLLMNLAFAECQINLKENPNIAVSSNMVIIDGDTYYIKGSDNKTRFNNILQECGANQSAEHLMRWRSAKGWTKGVLIGGLICGIYPAIFAIIPGVISKTQKEQLTQSLYIELKPENKPEAELQPEIEATK